MQWKFNLLISKDEHSGVLTHTLGKLKTNKMMIVCLIIASFWITAFFFDCIFKSCMFFPYIRALELSGISIKPFTISCYITSLNRMLQRLGHIKPNLVRKWFMIGTYVTCLATVPAFFSLAIALFNMIFFEEDSHSEYQMLKPVAPGVNLPISQFFYYTFALFLCSVLHEFGHALAAAREGVRIQGCGFFICCIIPGAFVDLPSEQLKVLSTWKQLSIFSAGIWHNIVLVIIAFGLLLLNPLVLAPAFSLNSGITVIDVAEESGLIGPAGLAQGNHITALNSCHVHDIHSWKSCILQISIRPQDGYCTSQNFILENSYIKAQDGKTDNCCGYSNNGSLCFTYESMHEVQNFVCLPVRKLLQMSNVCNNSSDCENDKDDVCVFPALKPTTVRLMQITRKNLDPVLYVGLPTDLLYGITASPWTSKFNFLPAYGIYAYETLLQYVASFSGSLAILNIIPCPKLDGQFLYHGLIELILLPVIPKKPQREFIFQVLMCLGCCLITGTLIMALCKLLI